MNDALLHLVRRSFTTTSAIRPRRAIRLPSVSHLETDEPDSIRLHSSHSIPTVHDSGQRSASVDPRTEDADPARLPDPGSPDHLGVKSPTPQSGRSGFPAVGSETHWPDQSGASIPGDTPPQQAVVPQARQETGIGSPGDVAHRPETRGSSDTDSVLPPKRADRDEQLSRSEPEPPEVERQNPVPGSENEVSPFLRPASMDAARQDTRVPAAEAESAEHVQIHIGRIEIQFPDTGTTQERRPPEPRMKLGEYLERRNKGRG